MEQLLDKKLYKRNMDTNKFNQNYITQLVKNYRCHPEILRKPSELFYGGLLEAAAPESMCLKLVIFSKDFCYDILCSILLSKVCLITFMNILHRCYRSVYRFW